MEVGTQSLWVELDETGQAFHLDEFHVIDQTVAVQPGVAAVATERFQAYLLAAVEFFHRFGEQLNGIINQGRRRLEQKIRVNPRQTASNINITTN